jgi:hypothetical protein
VPGAPPAARVAPWHMWGSSQHVRVTQATAGGTYAASVQLARINYRRPDTWRFWLAARLLPSAIVPAPGPLAVEIQFHLIVGVGRTMYQTELPPQPGVGLGTGYFGQFVYVVPAGFTPGGDNANNRKWTTRVHTPPLDDNTPTSYELCDEFPAQDIQCQGSVFLGAAPAGYTLNAELTAWFAPNVHMRPDWWTSLHEESAGNAGRFLGTERGGT